MSVAKYVAPIVLVPSLVFAPTAAMAEHNYSKARVVDVKPTYEMVSYTVPTRQCHVERVPVHYDTPRYAYRRSYTAPIVGAIIGGVVGNAVTHGKTQKRVGTAVGAVLGASIGADVSRRSAHGGYGPQPASYRNSEVCSVVNKVHREERLTGYRVKYSYAGETYVTHMESDPGKYLRVRVQVTPV
jgi:uncharacterized protein YcfJ